MLPLQFVSELQRNMTVITYYNFFKISFVVKSTCQKSQNFLSPESDGYGSHDLCVRNFIEIWKKKSQVKKIVPVSSNDNVWSEYTGMICPKSQDYLKDF